MEFISLEDIKGHFGIEDNDIIEIRRRLKIMLLEYHADTTGGEYKNRKQQRDYEEVAAAIEFLDSSETSLTITRKEWAVIEQKIKELEISKNKTDIVLEEEFVRQLDTSINTSVINFQKKHVFFKISSAIVTSVITALWLFPSVIENHKVLSRLIIIDGLEFTFFWLFSLGVTSIIWIYTKLLERRDDIVKKRYNLESTQNSIFKLFLAWLRAGYPHATGYDHPNDIFLYKFAKDDMVNFLLNYFDSFYRKFRLELTSSQYDLYQIVCKFFDDDKKKVLELPTSSSKMKAFRIFQKPGEIDLDIAQKITDTIISKLLNRGLISVSDERTFSETFIFTDRY